MIEEKVHEKSLCIGNIDYPCSDFEEISSLLKGYNDFK